MTREEAIEVLKKNRPGADPRRCGLELCTAVDVAISALREQCVRDATKTSDWISVGEAMPDQFVSVLGYMTDAGEFPSVRECYAVNGNFWFPALHEFHPVSHWAPMPTKEES